MKKIIFVLALLATVQVAGAQQVKSINDAKKAVESAKAAVDNPKKSGKTATWLKYGQALMDAYNAPAGNGWLGASRQDLQIVMGNEKPSSVENVVLGGSQWTKESYDTRDYYFTPDGKLGLINVTKPIDENALDKALSAYVTASSLDAKGQKTKDISEAIQNIATKWTDEAYNAYTFEDFSRASVCFEKAFTAAGTAPLCQLDTNSIYNAAFTAWQAGENERSQKLFNDCVNMNYYGEGGEVFAKLADLAEKAGKAEQSKDYLETGFSKFPQSQSILVGLINYYVSSGENTGRLFELLDEAKKNEPNNASLYYVEGNIHDKLGQTDEAVASYRKCAEIDPNYDFGYIGEGILFYNLAVKIQEEAQNEMDDAKWQALMDKFEVTLKNCIDPFEKALAICKDDQVKASIAEYLKNACFRFRTSDPIYQEKYDKYSEMVAASK